MNNRAMQSLRRTGTALAVAAMMSVAANVAFAGDGDRRNPNPGVLPPQSHPGGKSYGEWGAEWWKWAYSVPVAQNPIQDPDGRFGTLGQSGSVWFLAGTFGETAVRTLTIPTGKMIFFPIANIFNDYPCPDSSFHPAPGQTLEQFLTEGAMGYINQVSAMAVTVDGVPVKNPWNYRGTSPLTTFTADPSWVALDPCVISGPQVGVSDGYWIMLAPLPPGKHIIHFTAAEASLGFSLDVTYHLTVAKAPEIVQPDERYQGKCYGEWSAAWWEWFLELPPVTASGVTHPGIDAPTFDVTEGQKGNVWFLAATFGSDRTCTIPAGKALFIATLNAECSNLEEPPFYGGTPKERHDCAKAFADLIAPSTLFFNINGVPVTLADFRAASPDFKFKAPTPWIYGATGGKGNSSGDGYYVLLEPLPPGHYDISFGGEFGGTPLSQTYHLNVAPDHDGHDHH